MRIAYVVPELHKNGGIQEFAKSIYSELRKKFDIQILDWKNDLSLPVKGILRYSPPKIGDLLYSNLFSKHFKEKYKAIDRADLIHFWHLDPAIAFLDKRYIVTCHGMELLPANTKGFRKLFYPKVLNNAFLIHANSNFTKNLIIKLFNIPPRKIKVINPPIDYGKFAKTEHKTAKDKVIIGTLTRFNRRKNVPNTIKALNILKGKYNLDFKYYLVGDGREKERILSELDRAKFEWQYLGEISEDEKINHFYPSLDVFVMPPLDLPNDIEGFGIVYLEANACGVPVVAARTGGVPDAVREGVSGVFADPTNPEDIATKILELIENKEKCEKSTKEWARQFDVKNIAARFTDAISEIA